MILTRKLPYLRSRNLGAIFHAITIGPKMLEVRCREDAAHCERMAAIMLSKGQRDSYLQLAHLWRKLANDAGAHRLRVEAWTAKTTPAPATAALAGASAGGEPMARAD
jgi:hypothetical protein